MRQPIKNSSRVPAYQNGRKSTARCDFLCCTLPIYGGGLGGGGCLFSFFSLRQRKGHFLLVLFEKNVSEINAVVLTDEPDGPGRELPGLGRDTQLRQFFTMVRKTPCEGP